MNNTDNTFIASQVQTLEDLLKTNLCHGKTFTASSMNRSFVLRCKCWQNEEA